MTALTSGLSSRILVDCNLRINSSSDSLAARQSASLARGCAAQGGLRRPSPTRSSLRPGGDAMRTLPACRGYLSPRRSLMCECKLYNHATSNQPQ